MHTFLLFLLERVVTNMGFKLTHSQAENDGGTPTPPPTPGARGDPGGGFRGVTGGPCGREAAC